ncbi:MAG TPA: hypothetical protein VLH08_12115 [Acidobacteriota bacterium]|nr:hypothetical protein [Acidobacteriota bacterium]
MSDKKTDEEVKQNVKTTDLDETLPANFEPEGLAGKSRREAINLAEEEAYWKEKLKTRSYYNEGREYDEYATAFHYGWDAAARPENACRKFEDIEAELEREWPSYKGSNEKSWQHAKDSVRDAYDRIRVLRLI